jgi:hypothetical protein
LSMSASDATAWFQARVSGHPLQDVMQLQA